MTPITDVVPSDRDDEPPSPGPRRDLGASGPDVVAVLVLVSYFMT